MNSEKAALRPNGCRSAARSRVGAQPQRLRPAGSGVTPAVHTRHTLQPSCRHGAPVPTRNRLLSQRTKSHGARGRCGSTAHLNWSARVTTAKCCSHCTDEEVRHSSELGALLSRPQGCSWEHHAGRRQTWPGHPTSSVEYILRAEHRVCSRTALQEPAASNYRIFYSPIASAFQKHKHHLFSFSFKGWKLTWEMPCSTENWVFSAALIIAKSHKNSNWSINI